MSIQTKETIKKKPKEHPPNYKTKRCKNQWMDNGTCFYGKECLFAHNTEELRIIKINYTTQNTRVLWPNNTVYATNRGDWSNLNYIPPITSGCDSDMGSCDLPADCILL